MSLTSFRMIVSTFLWLALALVPASLWLRKNNIFLVINIVIMILAAAAAAKLLQSCPTLCDPTDDSPPGSAVPGILQARTLEWVAVSFSNA